MSMGETEHYELSSTEREAYDTVCKLNDELYGRFGDKEVDDYPFFSFHATQYTCAVLWGDICVWDSENSPDYDDDDNPISIESVIRAELDKIATAAEWIARDHAREKVSLDHCLFFLNGLVKVDAEALAKLIDQRVPCNASLAAHPTVQVQARNKDNKDVENPETEEWTVGLLGVLNGLFGAFRDGSNKDGWGQIAAVFEEDGRLSSFRRTKDPEVKPVEDSHE